MNEFVFLYRGRMDGSTASAQQMQAQMGRWQVFDCQSKRHRGNCRDRQRLPIFQVPTGSVEVRPVLQIVLFELFMSHFVVFPLLLQENENTQSMFVYYFNCIIELQ